jgi:hypothetical protein
MVLGAIISGAIGIAGGMASDAAANAAMERQHEYNMKVWNYNWRESRRDYRHAKRGVNIARRNEAAERGWRDTTALNDWNHSMAIRDYEYNMQMRAYNKSEQTYKQQLNFNNMAASVAMESENRFLDEQFIDAAFKNQDLVVQQLQEEGQAQLLQPGNSAGKAVQAVIAQAGRNQAILAESILSAKKQHSVNIKKIKTDKYGADIQAEANRMLKPEMAPALPKPIPLPTTIFQNPRKPRKPPKPIKGAPSNAGLISGAVGAAQGIVGAIKW